MNEVLSIPSRMLRGRAGGCRDRLPCLSIPSRMLPNKGGKNVCSPGF